MEQRLGIVTVKVRSLRSAMQFYDRAFGWRPWWPTEAEVEDADHAAYRMQSSLSFVLLESRDRAGDIVNDDFSLTYPAESRVQVDEIVGRVEAAGGHRVGEAVDEAWGYARSVRDLDGHLWEILWQPASGS